MSTPSKSEQLRQLILHTAQWKWFVWPTHRDAYREAKKLGVVVSVEKIDGGGYRVIRGVRLRRRIGYGDLERMRQQLAKMEAGQTFIWDKEASTAHAAAEQLGMRVSVRRQYVVTKLTTT